MPASTTEFGSEQPDPAIRDFVLRSGIAHHPDRIRLTVLTGGVASDIWLVEDGATQFCVKRALPRLRVAMDWQAPVERSIYEAAWLKGVAAMLPQAVPAVLADDTTARMFAMEYLPPEEFRCWKTELLAGRVDAGFAATVGSSLGRIHAGYARQGDAAARFPSDSIFYAIRLEPYLMATARLHPDRAAMLHALVARTASTKRTVVHGDVSPKNVLIGARGPVFLDAECAWFGDPAFDLAFCLNHMLLKCLAAPAAASALLEAFDRLAENYLAAVVWEDPAAVEARAGALLPGLFLGRVDGKSPVEYIIDERHKNSVRRVARRLLAEPPVRLVAVREAWTAELNAPGIV